jgi:two-component system phosphate regulon response regulator PhoB
MVMVKESILIIEDEPDIVELLQYNLEREGFRVATAQVGESGLSLARSKKPDLILLDLMLPGTDGLDVCRSLKQDPATRDTPLIMVTAKGEESDVVLGLEMGADDYVPKPFSPREVLARVRAVLRRNERAGNDDERKRIELGDVVLDADRHEVTVHGESVPFTRAEFRLLWALAANPGRVYTRDQLVDRITAGESVILDRNVDVHVSSIRKKLGDQEGLIATIRGVGYKCKD